MRKLIKKPKIEKSQARRIQDDSRYFHLDFIVDHFKRNWVDIKSLTKKSIIRPDWN